MRIEGTITSAFSEQVPGTPVVAEILQDDGTTRIITFERACWNLLVDDNPPLFFGKTRVVVEGADEYDCTIRLENEE